MTLTSTSPSAAPSRRAAVWRAETVDPIADPEWDRSLAAYAEATVFHTSAWARVLVATYGHRPHYLRFSHPDGSVIQLPMMEVRSWLTGKRGVCLPFSDQCRPLVSGRFDAPEVVRYLAQTAKERGWTHFEVRGGDALSDEVRDRQPNYCSYTLDLRPAETEIFDNFHSSVPRALRKAERSGVKTRVASDLPAVETYYRLHVQTRRKHGLPPQSPAFFRHLHREVIAPGNGFVVLAEKDAQPLAGAVYLRFGGHAVYKFGAVDETQQILRASNLVMWEGIRQLRQLGAETLDFGRTPLANEGLRRFKRSWGATEVPIHYSHRMTKSSAWGASPDRTQGWHNRIFGRLPLWANRFLGTVLYRHLD